MPEFTREYFTSLVGQSVNNGFPYNGNENELQFIDRLSSIIFDPKIAPKRVNLDSNVDMVKNSAINFYEGVSQKEASDFYKDANLQSYVQNLLILSQFLLLTNAEIRHRMQC